MKAKKKKSISQSEPIVRSTLYDVNVCGPEGLEIGPTMQNNKVIADWWRISKLYAEAMHGVGRAVMLCWDGDKWYWASVEESPNL